MDRRSPGVINFITTLESKKLLNHNKMPSKPKTFCQETTAIERAVVWTHYCNGLSYSAIAEATPHPKSTVASSIQRIKKSTKKDKFSNTKQCGAPKRVNLRGERALIRHAVHNTKESITVLGTPSKSGKHLSCPTVCKLLKRNGKAQRHTRKKPYLTKTHKRVRFRRSKQHRNVDSM
jgi:transposase